MPPTWVWIAIAYVPAVATNVLSAAWARDGGKPDLLLGGVLIGGAVVAFTFGIATAQLGLARASATVDALLAVTTVIAGLVLFGEWRSLSLTQAIGLIFLSLGLVLLSHSGHGEV